MTPADLPCLVVDGLQHRFAPSTAIIAAPTFRLLRIVIDVIHAESSSRIHIEQTRLWAEARRRPVRCTRLVRGDERPIRLWLLCWIRNRLPFGIQTLGPVSL